MHLRWAIRARAVPAQGCLRRQPRHPRCSLWCGGRPQSGSPCHFPPRAAAPGKSRTGFVLSPSLARPRLFPGARPRTASVFPNKQGSRLLFSAAGRKPAGRKPAPNFHEYAKRGAKRTPTHRNARKAELCSLAFRAFPLPAGGLRPKGRTKPASSQKKGLISERAQASPFAQKRLKS